jgi:glutamate synthase (NADPH/NADH) small chain
VDLRYNRINEDNIAIQERVSNYNEFTIPLAKEEIKSKDPDVWIAEPFCHSSCPLEI